MLDMASWTRGPATGWAWLPGPSVAVQPVLVASPAAVGRPVVPQGGAPVAESLGEDVTDGP